MEEYSLTSQDYNWLQQMIKNASSIETLYKRLFSLELSNQKDSEEFKTNMDYLKIAIEVENDLIKEEKLTYAKCDALMEYILNDRVPENFLTDSESLVTQDYRNRVLRRILGMLTRYMTSDYEAMRKDALPSFMADLLGRMGMPDPQNAINTAVYNSIEMKNALDQDIMNGFLCFLGEFTDSEKYKDQREALIATKYNVAYSNRDVEINMIASSFELPSTFYSNASFVAGITDTPDELLQTLKNTHGMREATQYMVSLIRMFDKDFEDNKHVVAGILRQCFLRSSFLLMDEEQLSALDYYFHDFTESDTYLNDHPDDHIAEGYVIRCFRFADRDKKRIESTSLGLN